MHLGTARCLCVRARARSEREHYRHGKADGEAEQEPRERRVRKAEPELEDTERDRPVACSDTKRASVLQLEASGRRDGPARSGVSAALLWPRQSWRRWWIWS